MLLEVDKIRTDGGTQARAEFPEDTLEEYVQALVKNAKFPPVVVFFDSADYWLADGFIRREAHVRTGRSKIEAEVREGTQRDAILYAVGANAAHGQRRTNADKRKAVGMLLDDKEWEGKTNAWISDQCRVGDKLVAEVRKERGSGSGSGNRPRLDRRGRLQPAHQSRRDPETGQPPAQSLSEMTEELVGAAPPEREPGDDTEQMAKDKAADRAAPKNGAPVFDWRAAEKPIGEANRLPDMVARAYAVEGNSAEFHQCREALGLFIRTWESWKKRLTRCRE